MTARATSRLQSGLLIFTFVVLAAALSGSARAAAVRSGFDANALEANDDESAASVLPFTINFFANQYSALWVNNNGNVTFDDVLSEFTPFDLNATDRVIIAPFFADVDTQGEGSAIVRYGAGTVDGRPAFGVNWVDVGYYDSQVDKLNRFQLVIIDRSDIAAGDFDFELNYDQIQWETGEASEGIGGLGGDSARAGYSNGTGAIGTFFELSGSAINGAFLDQNLSTGLIHHSFDSAVPGRYVFKVRNGTPMDTPTPTATPTPTPTVTPTPTPTPTPTATPTAAGSPCPVEGAFSVCTITVGDTVFSVRASSQDGGSLVADLYEVNGVNHLTFEGFALYDGNAQAFTSFELLSAEFDPTVPEIVVRFRELEIGEIGAVAAFRLTDSGDTSTLTETATIATTSESGLLGRLYMLTNWALNGTPSDDSVLITGGNTAVQVDGQTTGTIEIESPQPTTFDAAVCCTLISSIVGAEIPVSLQNRTSAPGPNQFESAFAWDFGLEPGTDFTATLHKTIAIAPTPTPTAPPTATPTAEPTPTATATATPTAEPTPTATATATPTAEPTPTATATATPTAEPTPTATATATPTAEPTPTATATATPTAEPTPTATATATPTAEPTPTATATATPTAEPTPTATATATPTAEPTPTATATATPTAEPTPTATATSTAVPTPTATATATPTATPTPTATATPTASPTPTAPPNPQDRVLFVSLGDGIYTADGVNLFNQLVAAGADADYVLLPSDPGGAAALLASNSYAQIWVYDLSAGSDPWNADFEAIADWWINDSGGEIVADGRILSSYWSGRYATEGRILAENYFRNLRAAGGGLMLSTDHDAFANFGANTIGELIGVDPFIGNFGGAFPVDTSNPLMNTPNLITNLFNDSTTSQAPFGLQPNGLILDAVGFHSGNPQNPGISSTIDGSLNLVVEVIAPESGTQLCLLETATATAETTGATGIVDYTWTSDLDGALGSGPSILLDTIVLTEGIHTIRVIAEDDENIDDAEITVEIGGCVSPLCGNGELDGELEQCDDGNTEDGDGCSSICQLEDPIVHGPYPLMDWPEAIQLNDSQDNAYIALQESGLDIHDVFDRDDASQLSNFSASFECSPQQFFADEVALIEEDGYVGAIISGGECGVVAADVTNANSPSFIDSIPIPFGLAEEVAGVDSADGQSFLLYVASYWQGLQIFEIFGECTSSCDVDPRGSIGADEAWGASLAVWIEVVPSQTEGPPQILAYVASTEGLQIVDVTDPNAPVLLGRLDTNPTNIPLADLDDVPQDVVVSGGLAFVPLWIGGFIVVDVQDPTNPVEIQRIAASPNTAFFKVEVSSRDNRIYVTEGISGLASFIQLPSGELVLEKRFPIGVDDERCTFVNGVSDICWAWAIDEVGELVAVTYGVLGSPQAGGYQLISMPTRSVEGTLLRTLRATPVPEPHLLILQGVGVLAVAGLGRLRRSRRKRSTQA